MKELTQMRTNPRVTVLVSCVAFTLVLSSCVGAKDTSSKSQKNADAKKFSLKIAANSVVGGKNDAEADWIKKTVIPGFEKREKQKGLDAHVKFQGSGVDDEKYKTKLKLNLKSGGGPDIIAIDGIDLGGFAEADYVKPLSKVVGNDVPDWSGWDEISKTVQKGLSYQDKRYGIPNGTDGRVLYFNKKLFKKAGLPTDWQPKSWDAIISAAKKLKTVSGITPTQINAGVPMGEATTTQGFLPLLAGTGTNIFDEKTKEWQGKTSNIVEVLKFYKKLYSDSKFGDAKMQLDKSGRDESFAQFSKGKIGILLESDYFWRSVVCPEKKTCSDTSMPDRDSTVGYARIPSTARSKGVNNQDFVSISGGTGWVLNPSTKYPQQAWDLLTYMQSKKSQIALSKKQTRITARDDVNRSTLANDKLLTYISNKVLPLTVYRPSNENYEAVSQAIQQATADVVSGKSPETAAKTYQKSVKKAVGAKHVTSG